jgi:siroheme synthase
VAVVENASLPDERVFHTTLAQLPRLANMQFEGPTVLLIGPQFAQRAGATETAERGRPISTTREKYG